MFRSIVVLLLVSSAILFGGKEISYAKETTVSALSQREVSFEEDSEVLPYPPHRFMTLGAIRTYQLLIAPSKGSECPMHPHCSLYGQMAFGRFNPMQAFIMTADRLHRCGHDLMNYDSVEVNDSVKFYDSLPDSKPKEVSLSFLEPTNNYASEFILQESSGSSEENRIFVFAEDLLKKQDFNRALTEYQRLMVYFPNSSLKSSSAKRSLQCYYQLGQYLDAVHWGQSMLKEGLAKNDEVEVRFYIGISYFRLKNFPKARERFQEIATDNNGILRDKALLLTGLSFVNEERWEDAQKSFANLYESEFSEKAGQLKGLANQGPLLKQKSPLLAGILAVVPGMGYLYDGYKQTALASFIVNGLFFWATSEAFKKDNEGLKPIMGILSFGWYSGNIYGSVVSANRKNERIKRDFMNRFEPGFSF